MVFPFRRRPAISRMTTGLTWPETWMILSSMIPPSGRMTTARAVIHPTDSPPGAARPSVKEFGNRPTPWVGAPQVSQTTKSPPIGGLSDFIRSSGKRAEAPPDVDPTRKLFRPGGFLFPGRSPPSVRTAPAPPRADTPAEPGRKHRRHIHSRWSRQVPPARQK